MSYSCDKPTVGPPGTSKTQLRRQQRRHTQHCYMLLQNKLLALLRPTPASAIQVEDLETFRADLFAEKVESPQLEEFIEPEHVHANICNWCGTWMPLPMPVQTITCNSTSDAPEAGDSTTLEAGIPDFLDEVADIADPLKAIGLSEPPSLNDSLTVEPVLDKPNNQLDWAGLLLAPLLCEVVSHIRCSGGKAKANVDVAEPCTNRLKKYSFKRTRICEVPEAQSPSSPPTPQYYTEESSGECKTQ